MEKDRRMLNIALLQLEPCGTLEENREKGLRACREAREMGADIALFPEMWSCGYRIYDRPPAEWKKEAIPAEGDFVGAFAALARGLRPTAGCAYANEASYRTLVSAGFLPNARLFNITLD